MNSGIFVRAALACDDVRIENTGKNILIGVYGPEIGVNQFPTQLLIRFVPIADFESAGEYKIKMRITGPDDVKFAEIDLTIEASAIATGVILPPLVSPISLKEKGYFRLEVKQENNWRTVERWEVDITNRQEQLPPGG